MRHLVYNVRHCCNSQLLAVNNNILFLGLTTLVYNDRNIQPPNNVITKFYST